MSRFLTFASVLMVSCSLYAQTNAPPAFTFPRWSPSVKAGSVYNTDASLSDGGSFSVNRYYIEAAMTRMWSFDQLLSISAGYGQEDYQFRNIKSEPWNNIDQYKLSAFLRWGFGEKWSAFAAPSIRSFAESGAALNDGVTGSFFGGFGYRFGDRLFLGPGIGIFGQVEDDPLYIPIILVNWDITDRLSLGTGGGFAATAGPGLGLTYKMTKNWKLGLVGRYERMRFRLSPDNDVENGVGEDQVMSIYGSIEYEWFRGTYIGGVFGANINGELSVSDEYGREIVQDDYGTSPVVGLVFGLSL